MVQCTRRLSKRAFTVLCGQPAVDWPGRVACDDASELEDELSAARCTVQKRGLTPMAGALTLAVGRAVRWALTMTVTKTNVKTGLRIKPLLR
jgi:hypothetical protein